MRLNFKTHFPWPGPGDQPPRTHFYEQIMNALSRHDGGDEDTDPYPGHGFKLHTIRRVKNEPRFRKGMTLQFCTGPRFKQKVFVEAPCTGVQLLRMGTQWVQGWGHSLTVDVSEGPGLLRPLRRQDIQVLAIYDGLREADFYRWFQIDVLTHGWGLYELVHWTGRRY